MRIASLLVLPVLGVGLTLTLSLTPACGSGGLTCGNPSPELQTCFTCLNTSCSTFVSSVSSVCSSYVSCLEACNCGDDVCAHACANQEVDAGVACDDAAKSLQTCAKLMCKGPCGDAL